MGLGGVRALGLEGEDMEGVYTAVDYNAALRQAPDLKVLPVGRRVVVIGGGNTAIDTAVQTRRLGAEEAAPAYRTGPAALPPTPHDQDSAQPRRAPHRHRAQGPGS